MATPLQALLAPPQGTPSAATYWNPRGAPRMMSPEIEAYLKQLELQAAANPGGLGRLLAPPAGRSGGY